MNLEQTLELIEFAKKRQMMKEPFYNVVDAFLRHRSDVVYNASQKLEEAMK